MDSFRLLKKIHADFQFGVYLQGKVLNHANTHSQNVVDN